MQADKIKKTILYLKIKQALENLYLSNAVTN